MDYVKNSNPFGVSINRPRADDQKPILENLKFIMSDDQHVREAIQDDYDLKWVPNTPVFISAQTGSGKNTFIEEVLIKKMIPLGYRMLLLSNRTALGRQEKERIAALMDKIAPRENAYRSYTQEVNRRNGEMLDEFEDFGSITIKSYQGYMSRKNDMLDHYDFIIFDECHFFLADAKFNKNTYQILEDILGRFPYSIRIYMTATPSEVIVPIIKRERFFQQGAKFTERRFDPLVYGRLPGQRCWDNHCPAERREYTLIDYNRTSSILAETHKKKTSNTGIVYAAEEEQRETHRTYNGYNAVVYELKRDYSAVNCKYLKIDKNTQSSRNNDKASLPSHYQKIVKLINDQIQVEKKQSTKENEKEKWLIFVPNKIYGKLLVRDIGDEYADNMDATSKNNSDSVYNEITKNEKFRKKVLVTTSVLDNGVNIKDLALKNIAIFVFDKVSFMQMLGRKRTEPNGEVTLYIQEYSRTSLNFKLQNIKKDLGRIYNSKADSKAVIREIFDNDDIFFCTSYEETTISYNPFMEDKLKCDKLFLEKFSLKSDQVKEDSQITSDITYDQFVQQIKGGSSKVTNEEILSGDETDFGQQTIIEQLSWLGKAASFDPCNYLEDITMDDLQEKKNELLAFLDSKYIKDEFPVGNKSNNNEIDEFYKQYGMTPEEQETFSEKFTLLYKGTFGSRKEDKSDDQVYRKKIINKCLSDENLPYELMSQSVKIKNEEGKRFNTDKRSMTFWVLVNNNSRGLQP